MYSKINSLNIYYQKLGKGQDLILLHGWKQDVSTWWPILDHLKEFYTLWLIDLPGFGRSDLPKKPFNILDYADVVGEFIKKNKINRPVLLGHSLGGRVAIKLACHLRGVKLDKLILESSAGIKPKRDYLKPLIFSLAKFSHLIPNLFNLKEKLTVAFYKSLKSDYLNAGPLKQTLKNILEEDLTDDLGKIETETLLIWGEKDPTKETSPKFAKKMYQLIKNSRLEVLEDVGHFPHLEAPEKFIYYVKDFI